MKRFCLVIMFHLLFAVVWVQAQEQVPDTLPGGAGLTPQDILELTRPIDPSASVLGIDDAQNSSQSALSPISATDIELQPVVHSRYQTPLFFPVRPALGSYLPQWQGGGLYGSSGEYGDFMTGASHSATLGVYQQLGDFSVTAGLQLNKYSVYYNTSALSGTVTWRPSRHFGVTVFGYYSPGAFLSPVNLGPSFDWGGYVTLQSDGMLGIDLGAHQYYDPMSGHAVTPIVRPYLMVGGSKLGIDFGPLLQNALQKDRRDGPAFNPIPQPIKAIPQVAPRR